MKQVRHTVEKIRPEIPYTFDQQFWPVLMAICVVGSMAAGAIVTLVQGPWMWASLLALPAAAALSIFLLYRLDDSVLRRSLQIAILASLAIHLLILVVTSLTFIFDSSMPDQQIVVARQPQKKIIISNRTNQLVVQPDHKHETPDVKIEQEKTQTTVRSEPQPIPVEEQSETVNQQIAERRENQPAVPRLEKQPTQLRRNNQNLQPVSALGSVASSATAANNRVPMKSATPAETTINRSDKPSTSSIEKQAAMEPARSGSQRVAAASQRRDSAAGVAAKSLKATALSRKSELKIPEVVNATPRPNSLHQPAKPMTSESNEVKLARTDPTRANVRKPTMNAVVTPSTTVKKSLARRETAPGETTLNPTVNEPRIVRPTSTSSPTAKLAKATINPVATTEAPQRTAEPKALAISRSTGGLSGSGRSKNLDRVQGGQPSPVNIASDSSHRRQSNRMTDNLSLSSLQRSERANRGRETNSQRVLRAETAKWASRSGSSNPSTASLQAAAANVDSSIAQTQDQASAEKGNSMVDLGPSKVVPETTADRRSGGGMPELSDSMVQNSQTPSGRPTNQAPSIQPTVETGQATNAESPEVATAQNPNADQLVRNQSGSTAAAADEKGDPEPPETSSALPGEFGAVVSQAVRRSESDASTEDFQSDNEADENDSKQGNSRTRLAQAPSVNRHIEFGFTGDGESKTVDALDSQLEATSSEISRSAIDALAGDGVLGVATQMAATSMAGLPLFEHGSGNSRRRESADNNTTAGQSFDSPSRGSDSIQPKINSSLPGIMNANNSESAGELATTESDGSGRIERQTAEPNSEAGAALAIDAPEGGAGFGDIPSRRVGSAAEASLESDHLSPSRETRFKRQEFGGTPATIPLAPLARQAFRKRNPAALAESGPSTEAAIEAGLEFLARHQLADGSWTLGQFDNQDPLFQSQLNSDTAATGLALLAFQGAGYNHREYKYARQIKAAIDWLIENQADSGGLYVEADKASNESSRLYSHAIAALALTEAYGMTQDVSIRDATQRALDYIANTQDEKRGGWRYFAELQKRESDTSVTGWMMMALQSGRLAGLETRQSTLDRIEAWLRVAQAPDSPSEFRYNPYAVDSTGTSRMHGRKASISMTSVGLLMRVYSGWGPGDPQFLKGAETLLQQLPSDRDSRVRDTYYWYYATQVMKHAGGEYWEQWNQALHPLLLGSQEKQGELAGSWHPYEPVPDRWGPQGGRIYVTTMNLLSLEVRYRLLPLYENTIR